MKNYLVNECSRTENEGAVARKTKKDFISDMRIVSSPRSSLECQGLTELSKATWKKRKGTENMRLFSACPFIRHADPRYQYTMCNRLIMELDKR